MTRRLLVIVPDRPSAIIAKGEYQPRYYNPGELFDEVHLLMTNDDQPDPQALQRTVGRAELVLHNLPEPTRIGLLSSRILREPLIQVWLRSGIKIAQSVSPNIVRCYGADWNALLASEIKARLQIPYVISMHANPDVNPVRRFNSHRLSRSQERNNTVYEYIERRGLAHADMVMPVYLPIVPYLERMGVRDFDVYYNVLDGEHIVEKTDYSRESRLKVVWVGRLFEHKDPTNLILALQSLPDVDLTLIGDGPLRPALEQLATSLGVRNQVIFRPSMSNQDVCRDLSSYDIFAVHSESWEIGKAMLEALLTGMPVVVNRRKGLPVPELDADIVRFVANTPEGYATALRELGQDESGRAELGTNACRRARAQWHPEITESRYASLYESTMIPN